MLEPPKPIKLFIVAVIMVFCAVCVAFGQNKPNVLIEFKNGLKQYGMIKNDTLYFIKGKKLIKVKKEVKSYASI